LKSTDVSPERWNEIYDRAIDLREKGIQPIEIRRRLNLSRSLLDGWIYRKHDPKRRDFHHPNLNASPELAYIIGAIEGDGCVFYATIGKVWKIRLHVTDRDFAEEFNISMAKVLQTQPHSVFKDTKSGKLGKKPVYNVWYTSKNLCAFLKSSQIYSVIESFPQDFIRGFADAEGSVSVQKYNFKVDISNTSIETLEFVKGLLKKHFDIDSAIYIAVRPNEHNFNKKTVFRLTIYRRASFRKYVESIGFSIARKREKLEEALNVLA
jgi:intein-encoded DNA endonuclease-like protein